MTRDKSRILDGMPGIFLDFFRLGASLLVYFIHAYSQWFPFRASASANKLNPAHAPVYVFFILSGYVITHTTTVKNRGGSQYIQARLSRLYSILIPALLITAICEVLVFLIDPALRDQFSRGSSFQRYMISGLFLNEIWFFSAAPPFNGPLWSLSFEFWFYVIFGIGVYIKKSKKIFFILLTCLIAGPKIVIMMPIWLLGYLAYRLPRPGISRSLSWILVFLCLVIATVLVFYIPALPYGLGRKPFFFANSFLSNWVISLFVAASLWLLPSGKFLNQPSVGAKRFRKIADLTFPLYILHWPLLLLWRSLFGFKAYSSIQLWEAIVSVFIITVAISFVLERQRLVWVRFFKWIFNFKRQPFSYFSVLASRDN
jgi:peptidoglycan/LPS O-acetylase OafA/YrhL